jgi:xylulokinase
VTATVLGIDLGSTWCKAGLYERTGRLTATGRSDSRTGTLGLGASDADLEHWWHSLATAVRALPPPVRPAALAVSCRGYYGVFLDGAMRSAMPFSVPQIPRDLSPYASAGWEPGGLWARAYAPIIVANVRWVLESLPDVHARIRHAGALHNYIAWRLTGRWVTDPASGPGGLPDWPPAAMSLSGLAREAFAHPLPSEATIGSLITQAASDLGVAGGMPVACGGHDGALANLGGGAYHIGDAMITLGTNTVLRIVTGSPVDGWFGYPLPPGIWAWVRGAPGTAPKVEAARERGRRAYGAALDAVAAAVQNLMETARSAGLSPRRFLVTGGLSLVPAMRRRLRSVLGQPPIWTDPESGMRGAGMLAAVSAGWYRDVSSAAEGMRYHHRRVRGAHDVHV